MAFLFEEIDNLVNIAQSDNEAAWLSKVLFLFDMHNVISAIKNLEAGIIIGETEHLAYVEIDRVFYDYSLANYSYDDILYVVSHELSHVVRRDTINEQFYSYRLLSGIILFFLFIHVCLPLVVLLPFIDELIYCAIRRHVETKTDVLATEIVSLPLILANIKSREPKTRFGWILYDHATTNKFIRYYTKAYRRKLKKGL